MQAPPVKVVMGSMIVDHPWMITWCHEQWGSRWGVRNSYGRWASFYRIEEGFTFHFETEEMATLFLLRWK